VAIYLDLPNEYHFHFDFFESIANIGHIEHVALTLNQLECHPALATVNWAKWTAPAYPLTSGVSLSLEPPSVYCL
jgi:hypothetical protein